MEKIIWILNQLPVSATNKITLPDVVKRFTTSFYTAFATNVRCGNQEKELEALLNNLKQTAAQLVEAYHGLVERVLVLSLQVLAEEYYFEKIHWSSAIKRIPGVGNALNLKQ